MVRILRLEKSLGVLFVMLKKSKSWLNCCIVYLLLTIYNNGNARYGFAYFLTFVLLVLPLATHQLHHITGVARFLSNLRTHSQAAACGTHDYLRGVGKRGVENLCYYLGFTNWPCHLFRNGVMTSGMVKCYCNAKTHISLKDSVTCKQAENSYFE